MIEPTILLWTAWLVLGLFVVSFAPRPGWLPTCWKIVQVNSLLQVGLAGFGLFWGSDPLGSLMLLLIGFLVGVIAGFARQYLLRDPREAGTLVWLTGVWVCVTQLALAPNLLWLALAWTGTSLCLHKLIGLDRQRPAAMRAARRKFQLARLADLALYASLALLWQELGTLEIEKLGPLLSLHPTLSPALQASACLLAAVAILKSGQVPFHGWLIQVMEAPTPISALLHAGAINIAGFVLIRVAPLLSLSEPAQLTLVAWGGATALLAGLVMLTQSSVKSALAWSTSAQMGFMLMECGLGAYSLAMLHLLAHSLYKAYSFLNAGDTVWQTRRRQLTPPNSVPAAHRDWMVALGLCLLVTVTAPGYAAWTLAMTPLWLLGQSTARWWLAGFLLATLYHLQHSLLGVLIPSSPPSPLALTLAVTILLALWWLYRCLLLQPQGKLAGWLYPRALAGFHLDEGFCAWFESQSGGNRDKLD